MTGVSGHGRDEFDAFLDSVDWPQWASSDYSARTVPSQLRALRDARTPNEVDDAVLRLEGETMDDARGEYLPEAVPTVMALFILLKSEPEKPVRMAVLGLLEDFFAIETKPWWPEPDDLSCSAAIRRILRAEMPTYEANLSDPDPLVRGDALSALAVVDPDRRRAAERMAWFEREDPDPEIQRVVAYVRQSHWWRSLQE